MLWIREFLDERNGMHCWKPKDKNILAMNSGARSSDFFPSRGVAGMPRPRIFLHRFGVCDIE
jgi:hypothetical protein